MFEVGMLRPDENVGLMLDVRLSRRTIPDHCLVAHRQIFAIDKNHCFGRREKIVQRERLVFIHHPLRVTQKDRYQQARPQTIQYRIFPKLRPDCPNGSLSPTSQESLSKMWSSPLIHYTVHASQP